MPIERTVSFFFLYRSDAFHAMALAGIENRPELAGLDKAAFERAPAGVSKMVKHVCNTHT